MAVRGHLLDAAPLAEVLRAWSKRDDVNPCLELNGSDGALYRNFREIAAGKRRRVTLDVADELLIAIDEVGLLNELYPLEEREP